MTNVREHRSWSCSARYGLVRGALAAGIVFLLLIVTRSAAQERRLTYSVLYSFTGGADGSLPYASLVADGAGNLYGTTQYGGNTSSSCPYGGLGCGVVFKLDPSENETVLYAFTGGADGWSPRAGLIRDAAGNLYGTTAWGGNSCGSNGCGVVFKVDPQGTETVLYAFTGGADGWFSQAGLIRDRAGNLYGTTAEGGTYGAGVVFKLDPVGKQTVLYTFTGGADGGGPYAGLIRDSVGNFYGTTAFGGNTSSSCIFGGPCGVVFKLDPSGKETVLYSFTGGPDGGNPYAGLIRDRAGNLYGTAEFGGNPNSACYPGSCGVVFELDSSGHEKVLYAFTGGADGAEPAAGLIRDAAGNFYGTTLSGGNASSSCGSYGCGVVFKLSPSGRETVLYTFTGGADGSSPYAGLLQYKGSLYGTASVRGTYGNGVVFKLQ